MPSPFPGMDPFIEPHKWRALAYKWNLRDPLPTINIPLSEGEPDVPLDLQQAFTSVYDRARYDYLLNYSAPIEPPLDQESVSWIREVLEHRK